MTHAQPKDCGVINVKTKTIPSDKGRSNGSIELIFESSESKSITATYKVFIINAGEERARKPVEQGKIKDLRAGFYDILVIDRKGCNKQLTVSLPDK